MSTLLQQTAPPPLPPSDGGIDDAGIDDAGIEDAVSTGDARDVTAELSVDVRLCTPRALVSVTGTVDATGGVLLTAMLDHVRSQGRPVDLDLSGVTAVDAAGLAVVLDAGVGLQASFPSGTRAIRVLAPPGGRAADRLRPIRQRSDQETVTCRDR